MGAVGGYWPKGTPTKKIAEDICGQPFLDSAVKANVFYGVFESRITGKKMMAVMPISRYQGETALKMQDEEMGPYDTQCPDRLLDMLDPTDNDYANEWREKCRAYNAKIAQAKSIKAGTTIVLTKPVEFSGGYGSASRFTYTGKQARFYAPEIGVTVNLGRNWPTREYTVEEASV